MNFRKRLLWIAVLLCVALPGFSTSKSIEITCQKSFYTPDVIRVKKGEPVTLVLSTLDVTHGFAIDEFRIATEVAPGPPKKIEFTPDREGEFYFYCVIRCGKKHLEMRGKLIVE